MNLRFAGIVLIILLAGCSASHTANPTSVIPGTPGLTSQGVDPFKRVPRNVIHKYPLPNPNSNPYYIATGSDKNVWFTELLNPRIGKITQSGVITEYAIPSGTSGIDIAAGASGTLWFSEQNGSIGKINTTTGHITEFPVAPGVANGGIAKGPDGNMWFTDSATNSIGKMTPTGTVSEYPLQSGAQPDDIAAGPDGNLWFVGQDINGRNEVGKITTAGVVTEYSGGQAEQEAIAAGPDGNLYAGFDGGIERVTTSGVITAIYGATGLGYLDIILGPDKQMWLNRQDGQIVEFNPKTQEFDNNILPDPSHHVNGLTVGGDGDVWITAVDDNSILVYEEKVTTIGIRLNGELSFIDPNYGFELGYAVGRATQTQTISLSMGESVQFKNFDTNPHSAAFLGNATSNSAPWPGSFNGSTTKSPAGTAIGTTGWATGSLNANETSPIYETGLPGFYMIGCQYHYNTNEMRTVIVVH